MGHKLLIATRNEKKRAELAALLADLGCEVATLAAYPDAPEVEETGETFEANATLKACSAADATGLLALADDSGLAVDALGGAPGVHSARYAATGSGNASDEANVSKLLAALADVPESERTARFVCAVAIAEPGRCLTVVRGTVEGCIARQASGRGGFGYDPVFFYPPFEATFAEVSPERKASVSHRGKALAEAKAWLAGHLGGS